MKFRFQREEIFAIFDNFKQFLHRFSAKNKTKLKSKKISGSKKKQKKKKKKKKKNLRKKKKKKNTQAKKKLSRPKKTHLGQKNIVLEVYDA